MGEIAEEYKLVVEGAEQEMLPFEERKCTACNGSGVNCGRCRKTGKLQTAHEYFDRLGLDRRFGRFDMWLQRICISCRGSGVILEASSTFGTMEQFDLTSSPCRCRDSHNLCPCFSCLTTRQEARGDFAK
jgi:hypothetical protein